MTLDLYRAAILRGLVKLVSNFSASEHEVPAPGVRIAGPVGACKRANGASSLRLGLVFC